MKYSILIALSLATLCQTRFLQKGESSQTVTTAYAGTLACGECIRGGYTYCSNVGWGVDHQSTAFIDPAWGNKCYQTSAPELTNNQWLCSSAYAHRAYAKNLCYYNPTSCGVEFNFTLGAQQSRQVNVTNLLSGASCFYYVQSYGYANAFTVNTTAASGTYDIEWMDFDDSVFNNAAYVPYTFSGVITSATNVTQLSPPKLNQPPRNFNPGNSEGGAKIDKADIYSGVSSKTKAKAGRWSQTSKGKHVWGVEEQGAKAMAMVPNEKEKAKNRYQYVSVTAVGQTLPSLSLMLTTEEFGIGTGGVMLFMSAAASMISLLFAGLL